VSGSTAEPDLQLQGISTVSDYRQAFKYHCRLEIRKPTYKKIRSCCQYSVKQLQQDLSRALWVGFAAGGAHHLPLSGANVVEPDITILNTTATFYVSSNFIVGLKYASRPTKKFVLAVNIRLITTV